ncbi:MAG: hypothetical protein KF817_02815 [Phycisphaeraceae bacterium]|nr:hypothetical protein [Phycisphaeraceae bacterium]
MRPGMISGVRSIRWVGLVSAIALVSVASASATARTVPADATSAIVVPAAAPTYEFRAATSRLGDGGTAGAWRLLALLVPGFVLCGGVAGAWILWHRADRRRGGPAVRMLAARAGLSWRDGSFISRMAHRAGCGTGGGALLSPGCFEHMIRVAAPSPDERRRLERLRDRVHPG